MLTRLYVKMCDLYPGFRKSSRKQMYQLMAYGYKKRDWTFMNYGYAPDSAAAKVVLHAHDEINRYCIQLYHYVASAVELRGLKLLEVGSGRGVARITSSATLIQRALSVWIFPTMP